LFHTALHRNARLYGNSRGIHSGKSFVGWAGLVERADRLAGTLTKAGVRPGDRVAAVLPNGEAMLELFALASLYDIVVVPLNFRWNAQEIADALADCSAAALLTDRHFKDLAGTASKMAQVRLFNIDEGVPHQGQGDGCAPSEAPAVGNDAHRLMAIFYTGGTTGRPKGVMLSKANIGYSALSHMAAGLFGELETVLHVSPAFHIAGALGIFSTYLSGGEGVTMAGFDAGEALSLIAEHRVTQALLVPTMLRMVLESPARASADLSSINTIAYGAAPMPQSLLALAKAAMPAAQFTQLYGMTETAPTSCILRQHDYSGERGAPDKVTSVGRPIAGTEVRIVDAEGREVERGIVGEICTRGPGVMLGYWNNAEQTDAVLREGWMHTGDGGSMDDDGYVFLADRLKDMIITGGENVFSVEVENVLSSHPAVSQCAVIGVPDAKWGEAVHAVVVPHSGSEATAADLIRFCRDRLTGFKVPRGVSFWEGALPMSGAGKILKRELRHALGISRPGR
jgi:long-chain acyl-CoA synthetase